MMDPDIAQAIKRAGFKLGGGLLVLAAVVGLRVVTASPDFVEDEVAELAAIDLEASAPEEAVEPSQEGDAASTGDGESIVARLGAGVRERLPGGGAGGSDSERLVSCAIEGRTNYMRAADCAARGGRSTDLAED